MRDDDAIFRAIGAYSGTTRALADTRLRPLHGHHYIANTLARTQSVSLWRVALYGRDARARALDTRNRPTRHTCARNTKRERRSTNVYNDGSSERDCHRGERGSERTWTTSAVPRTADPTTRRKLGKRTPPPPTTTRRLLLRLPLRWPRNVLILLLLQWAARGVNNTRWVESIASAKILARTPVFEKLSSVRLQYYTSAVI